MRFGKNSIKFSPKETKVLIDMWKRLLPYSHLWIEEMTPIINKLKSNSTITPDEWQQYLKWRRPKGTPLASPGYMQILNLYFKKRTCKACSGLGHDKGFNMCRICVGSGVDPKVKELLGK